MPKLPTLQDPETFDPRADAFLDERAAHVFEWVAYTLERLRIAKENGNNDPARARSVADDALCDFITALGHPEIAASWKEVIGPHLPAAR